MVDGYRCILDLQSSLYDGENCHEGTWDVVPWVFSWLIRYFMAFVGTEILFANLHSCFHPDRIPLRKRWIENASFSLRMALVELIIWQWSLHFAPSLQSVPWALVCLGWIVTWPLLITLLVSL